MSARCVYLDLDGTLLGRGASLLHDGAGNVSIEGVRAVQACLRAGVTWTHQLTALIQSELARDIERVPNARHL